MSEQIKSYTSYSETKSGQANDIINRRTLYAAGIGLIPVPIVDAAALIGVQIYMVRDIAIIYDVPFKEERIRSLISALVGDITAVSLFKFIPFLGTLFGGASASVMSAGVTYALGKVFVKHFEEGGTFLNFDTVASEKYFKEKIKEGKKLVRQARKSSTAGSTTTAFNEPLNKSSNESLNKSLDKSSGKKKDTTVALEDSRDNKKLTEEVLLLRKEIESLKALRKRNNNNNKQVEEEKESAQIAVVPANEISELVESEIKTPEITPQVIIEETPEVDNKIEEEQVQANKQEEQTKIIPPTTTTDSTITTDINLENLQIISGIGTKTAKVLRKAGIKNLIDLSKTTPEALGVILKKAKGNFTLAVPDSWIIQAQLLVKGDEVALKKLQEKLQEKLSGNRQENRQRNYQKNNTNTSKKFSKKSTKKTTEKTIKKN